MLHLAGHALAKGGLFLAADGVYGATGGYQFVQTDLLRRSSVAVWSGALFAAMSLAAMPPQAGFVSEWYMFETVFQGFRLDTLTSRLVMALAGAGLALTVAIAFATYVKVFGIGLLGRTSRNFPRLGRICICRRRLALGCWRLPSECRFGSTRCGWPSSANSERKPRATCMMGCCLSR